MADEHVVVDCATGEMSRATLTVDEVQARNEMRSRLTPAALAAQVDSLSGAYDPLGLLLRAIISLMADSRGVTDKQARAAIKQRMQDIAEGKRE